MVCERCQHFSPFGSGYKGSCSKLKKITTVIIELASGKPEEVIVPASFGCIKFEDIEYAEVIDKKVPKYVSD